VRSLTDMHIVEERMSMVVVFHVIILNFKKTLYEKRPMLPYRIGCVYRFVDNILYRLSEYRLKVISVQHYLVEGYIVKF